MKKFIKTLLLVGLFISFSSSDSFSQTVTNNTGCNFYVAVGYSFPGCVSAGSQAFPNIPGGGGVAFMSVPFGARPFASKGVPVQLLPAPNSCPYYIGVPCTGYTLTTTIFCPAPAPLLCPVYTATLNPFTGNITIN